MRCPNATRHKRVHPGGGKPGCTGKLNVILSVGVTLPGNRWPKGGDMWSPEKVMERCLAYRYRHHGLRLSPRDLLEAFVRKTFNFVCPTCGWQLKGTPKKKAA